MFIREKEEVVKWYRIRSMDRKKLDDVYVMALGRNLPCHYEYTEDYPPAVWFKTTERIFKLFLLMVGINYR